MEVKKAVQKMLKYLEVSKKLHYYLFWTDFSLKTNAFFN